MSQFKIVQAADRSPSCCMVCGRNDGPFIDFDVPFIKVPTAIGVLDSNGGLYLCVGNDNNPGCAVQVGRMSGQMVDFTELVAMEAHALTLADKLAEANALLKKKTVTVGEVQHLLHEMAGN